MTQTGIKQHPLADLQEMAKLKPKGWLETVMAPPAKLTPCGRWVQWPEHRYNALRLTYSKARPSLIQKVRGLIREVIKWKQAGMRITHWRVFLSRNAACSKCPFSVPGVFRTCGRCGCTRAKLWLETARCPERRWRV